MYRLALITAIFCTLLLQFAPATAHARGDFSRDCRDFKYDDGILSAFCDTHQGYVQRTKINLNHLLFWKSREGCGGDNCYYLAWGKPGEDDIYLSGYKYPEYYGKKFTDLKYWFSTTSSPLYLHGRGCYSSWLGLKWSCSDSDIDLDEHIKNNNGTLEYVP